MSSPLDNPIWHSLTSRHAHLALGNEAARRYPPEIAPFAAIPTSSEESEAALANLVEHGAKAIVLNVMPKTWQGWTITHRFEAVQYVWENTAAEPDPEAIPLGPEHLDRMLDLTALVYPAYFRKGTAELGDYFGIVEDGQLCAMAGIRMAFRGHQEISAICTHPDHQGKGCASRLTRHLIHHIQTQGDTPFLHTESDNHTARRLYDRLGFALRATLPIFVAERTA